MASTQLFKHVKVASFQESKNNNPKCGDAFFCIETNEYFICAVSDGLGSGQLAFEASNLVISYIKKNHHHELTTLMHECNRLLVNKRGVVLSIVKVDYHNKKVAYSNMGNINCIFYSPDGVLTRTIPKRGFLSGKKISFTTQDISYQKGMRFIIFTDGMEVDSSLHKLISKEVSAAEVIPYIKANATFKNDDKILIVGDLFR